MSRLFAGTKFDRPPHCDRCDRPEDECTCPPPEPETIVRIAPEKQTARLAVEKRKMGKWVTVIRDLDAADLPDLLVRLKSKCGAGGSLQENAIEIQGRHLDRVRDELKSVGYRVKG